MRTEVAGPENGKLEIAERSGSRKLPLRDYGRKRTGY